MRLPTYTDIAIAHEKIKAYIHRTPILTCSTIDEIVGAKIYFKCENFQKVGAFKFRGACNAVFSLSASAAAAGVGTHSSGNHAQALALSAKMRGIPSYIVMPENSPQVKIDAVKSYGAKVYFCKPTLADRERTMQSIQAETGCYFIHPYSNTAVISGQGTAAKELLEETPFLDYLITPIGGGGLLSGSLIAANHQSPTTKVIAAEPIGADDAYRSWNAGYIMPSESPNTIADGLLTSVGEINFEIMKKYLHSILTATDEDATFALKLIWERMKIVVEPSSAFALSIAIINKDLFKGKTIGIILSGGNADITQIAKYFENSK